MKAIKYQLIMVLNPKLEKKDRDGLLTKIGELLSKSEAEIKEKDNMGLKDLAYPIAKLTRADYWKLRVETKGRLTLAELNLFLNRDKNVIRYLMLKE